MRLPTFVTTIFPLALAGCSAADLAAVRTAAGVAGAAVDTFALVRAEQIRAKGAAASDAAARGDTETAMAELNAALAAMAVSTLQELQDLRARCPAPPPSAAGAP